MRLSTTSTLFYITFIAHIKHLTSKTCCITRDNPGDCALESGTGSPCTWLDPSIPSMAAVLAQMSEPANCVNADYAACKAADPSDPCVADSPPPFLLGPDKTPDDCETKCTSPASYNVQFIIDESGTINTRQPDAYVNTIDFVHRLIVNSIPENSKISLLTFSVDTDSIYPFNWDQTDRNAMLSVLAAEKTNYAGLTTDIYNAMMEGLDDFIQNCSPNEENILILLTDGEPYCGIWNIDPAKSTYDPGCKINLCNNNKLNDKITAANARVVIIGAVGAIIGQQGETIHCFSDPQDQYELDDFNPETFNEIEVELRENLLCPETPPKKKGTGELMVNNGWDMSVVEKEGGYYYWMGVILMIGLIVGAIYWCKSNISNKKNILIERGVNGYSTFDSI